MKKIMNNKPHTNSSAIIASSIDVPNLENDFTNLMNKIEGLPLREIEVELDTIELIEKFGSKNNIKTTAMVNYPLGGYQAEYILESIRWACEKKFDIICTSLPLFWLRSNETSRIRDLIREIISACGKKTLRISLESDSLSREELSSVCDLICDAGISHLKSSCGFFQSTSTDDILFIRKNYPNLLLTVDNNLRGDSIEIDNLLQLGVNYVCVKEPWLYHF